MNSRGEIYLIEVVGINAMEISTDEIINSLLISQSYPNPFNPYTTISYQLPKTSYVELIIYNLLGQKVATLIDREMSAGSHSDRWDAQNVPSGIYFLKMDVGNNSIVKKALVAR